MTETISFLTPDDQIVSFGPGEKSLEDNFRRFHQDNPHVYKVLRWIALEWSPARPGEKCGIGMMFEVARWKISLATDGEPVKLNNNYRAFYARMLMEQEPELEGMFETRRQRA